jgi:hypothetical protein
LDFFLLKPRFQVPCQPTPFKSTLETEHNRAHLRDGADHEIAPLYRHDRQKRPVSTIDLTFLVLKNLPDFPISAESTPPAAPSTMNLTMESWQSTSSSRADHSKFPIGQSTTTLTITEITIASCRPSQSLLDYRRRLLVVFVNLKPDKPTNRSHGILKNQGVNPTKVRPVVLKVRSVVLPR